MASNCSDCVVPASVNDGPIKKLSEKEFILEVEKRPILWNTYEGKRKVGHYWRQIASLTWPEFERWSPDVKRVRCLELQKDWKMLRDSFIQEFYRRQKDTALLKPSQPTTLENYDSLTFLLPTILKKTEVSGKGKQVLVVKKLRTEPPPVKCSCNCQSEDQMFLLSLVSLMQSVSESHKLALRSDMLQLIAKYTSSTTEPNTSKTKKQILRKKLQIT